MNKPVYVLAALLLAGCAGVPASGDAPYCVVKDAQGRDVILFGPSREQKRRFENSHINAKPVPEFPSQKEKGK